MTKFKEICFALAESIALDDNEIANKLHARTANSVSPKEKSIIRGYASGSAVLNKSLMSGSKLGERAQLVHDTIKKHAKPAGMEVHLYSGTGPTDFSALAKKSKDGILHSPAHISASHDKHVADEFAFHGDRTKGKHMIKIHVQPHDKILHISKLSQFPEEKETIIPAGTKLKYSHTEDGHIGDKHLAAGKPIKIHHFTIHSQEDSK